ncbi:eukaryotic translation initiation factor 5 [Coemansia sp. RSA 1365]|nr:eukaryotic translation initiation factor 5 [Coemansia sp. RSA 1365]
MATNINIRRDVKDPFYRYKMPRLQSKVEGKGNGIKTVLPNIVEVSRALSRPPAYPTKYFGNELGAQTKIEDKNDRFIVNGAHDADKLQSLLDGFIERFVLCGSCKSPETDLLITKDQSIIRKCMACGHISDVDMRHRLATYIIKNPPPKEKKGGKHASSGARQDNSSASASANGDEIDVLAHGTAQLDISADEDDDDWGYDEDAAAEISVPSGGLVQSPDDEDDEDDVDPFDQLGDYINSGEYDDSAIYAKAVELGLGKNHRTLVVIIQCLFEGSTTFVKDIAKHHKLLIRFGKTDKHQRAVIGGFERVVEANIDQLLSKLPAALMALFEKDIVEEDVFLEWSKKPSKKYVSKESAKKIHKAAQPFIEWLENAEEESDSD